MPHRLHSKRCEAQHASRPPFTYGCLYRHRVFQRQQGELPCGIMCAAIKRSTARKKGADKELKLCSRLYFVQHTAHIWSIVSELAAARTRMPISIPKFRAGNGVQLLFLPSFTVCTVFERQTRSTDAASRFCLVISNERWNVLSKSWSLFLLRGLNLNLCAILQANPSSSGAVAAEIERC